jgi:bla regulator protein blaR1
MSIVTHLLESTACAGVAAILAYALRHAHGRTRHTIWLCASLKFLVPFSLLAAAGSYAGGWIASSPEAQTVARWLSRSMPRWSIDVSSNIAGADTLAIGRLGFFAVTLLWVAGAAALAGWRWRQWREISALVAEARPLVSGREADVFRRVRRSPRQPRPIALLQSSSPLEPGVVGIWRPRILWPAGLSERLSDAEIESVLSHEACHVDRRDGLAALAQIAVEILFWFHPMVWWIGARLVHERERACDEQVLLMGTDERRYAESILKVCGFCLRAPAAFVAGVSGSDLAARVERIVRRSLPRPIATPVRLLLSAVLVAAIGVPVGAGVLSAHQSAQEQERKIYRVRDGVKQPKLVYEVKPSYTADALKEKIQGSVKLEAVISEAGLVEDVEVTQSLDTEYGLDQAAIDALKQWRFEPGTKDDKPVAVRIEVEMTFHVK